jgi:hypothetical protein
VTEASSLLLPRSSENPEFGSGCIFFVGNATLLIRYAGFTILTDPNSSTPATTHTWATA